MSDKDLIKYAKILKKSPHFRGVPKRISKTNASGNLPPIEVVRYFKSNGGGSDALENGTTFDCSLRSFLVLVTYLGKFIPDLATTTEPLRQLTRRDAKFNWSEEHNNHFEKLEQVLTKPPTLSYFDPKKRTRLIADASPVALNAVLIQFECDTPKVVSFASKGLSDTERWYSQTEKESLALVWAVERFYFYLTGLEFELATDHKPLEAIFKPTSKPPARIER
ncbi:hypothetical protein JTB14_018676 [Gonioctena quinquepunctata]|nr:hypothetical protein JTB14_018676 [Gonioctena quinquepunctata]